MLKQVLEQGMAAGEYTAVVYTVGRHGTVSACESLGRLGEEGSPDTTVDSIFDIASLTKPVVTATSLMLLAERGNLSLDQRVTEFFPEYPLPRMANISLHHLATHTSGLPAWQDMYSSGQSRDEVIHELLSTPPDNPPGHKHVYSCLGYILLGLVIERATGESLATFARRNILDQLGMHDTAFNPPEEWRTRIACTAHCPNREGILCGEVHDGNAWAMGGVSGNAGLFSTVRDLGIFARMMLNGGEHSGVRILSKESVDRMLTNRIDPKIGGQAHGFFVRPSSMLSWAESFSPRAAGHSGFTGTSMLLDPENDIFAILLTNRIFKNTDASVFQRRRRLFHDVVFTNGVLESHAIT